ncbi:ClpP/crotonase-like domain-containing protein [Sphaerosporella brunnea]|uniref:ClpP/crotonase-like domain-containing protein n=1 Tax=Sphaerosporella brunnea TaxID=1250544 RepID=A0A5J5ES08_9PEZI|nr:ClpP/crotonase-like domain-containing protein [Sphaerosporella brunnea]
MRPTTLFRVSQHTTRATTRITAPLQLRQHARPLSAAAETAEPTITTRTFPAPHTGLIKLLLLSRPAAKNALSVSLVHSLQHTLSAISSGADKTTRAIIIGSAVPGVFCAGADLKERRCMTPADVEQFLKSLRGCLHTLENLPIPTISAISGFALGGGLELALATDLRIVSPAAQLGLPETRLGIIPGAGGTYRLPRLVGRSRALDIILSGRRVGAIEAVQIGLANRIVDLGDTEDWEGRERTLDAALEVAREICTGAPIAIRVAKRVVSAQSEEAENRGYLQVVGTRDRDEALKAFKEKRNPVFEGL